MGGRLILYCTYICLCFELKCFDDELSPIEIYILHIVILQLLLLVLNMMSNRKQIQDKVTVCF